MELKGTKINFLGDSITEGYRVDSIENIYINRIKKSAGLKEARNYGIGGTRITRYLMGDADEPSGRDFVMRAEEMDADADIVVVFGGTNDYGAQAPMGVFGDKDIGTFYGALDTLITILIKKYLGKPIVFLTPLHRLNEDGHLLDYNNGRKVRPLCDYVKAMREVCEYYSVPVLDMYKESGIAGNFWPYCEKYMDDGLHPNDLGHAQIAYKIEKFLKEL